MRLVTVLALAAFAAISGIAIAAQQPANAKLLLVRNPPSGNKRIVYLSRLLGGANTVVGDPVANGATFTIALSPSGTQCVSLPASGWSPIGSIGFKYRDAELVNGPVKVASIIQKPSGVFLLKVIARGAAITVAPPVYDPGYGISFEINGGDQYCASDGGATIRKNDERTFLVRNDYYYLGGACTTSCSSPSTAFLDEVGAF